MSRWYLDTSAAAKLLVEEPESAALIDEINRVRPELVASLLLETELRRMTHRIPQLSQELVSSLLQKVSLYAIEPAQFTHAGLLPGVNLRSLDALHLAAAIDLQADALVTYDLRLAASAHEAGLATISP